MLSLRNLIAFFVPTAIIGFSCFWYRHKFSKKLKRRKHVNVDGNNRGNNDKNKSIINDGNNRGNNDKNKSIINEDIDEDDETLSVDNKATSLDEPMMEPDTIVVAEFNHANKLETEFNPKENCFEDKIVVAVENVLQSESQSPDIFEEDVVTSDQNEDLSISLCKEASNHNEEITIPTIEKTHVKRARNQSSCDGDSAIVDDYSSDNISTTGSDTVKSPGHMAEEIVLTSDKALNLNEDDISYEEWYGQLFRNINTSKVLHWGSAPPSDAENELNELSTGIKKLSPEFSFDTLEKQVNQLSKSHFVKQTKSKKLDSKRKSPQKGKLTDSPRKGRASESPRKGKMFPVKQNKKPKKDKHYRKELDESWRKPQEDEIKREDDCFTVVEYEFPDDLCGRLIGKAGKHISELRQKTGAEICVEPELRGKNSVVNVSGLLSQIAKAEKLLNNRFDDKFNRINDPDIESAISNLQYTSLPSEVSTDIIVTAIADAGNFFIQIFHSDVDETIVKLQKDLSDCYCISRAKYNYTGPPTVGDFCISFIDNMWYRLNVTHVLPNNQVVVSFVDYGGNVIIPVDILRKIRTDFLDIPVQVVECYLANVIPLTNELEYSFEATTLFSEMIQGQVMQANVKSMRNNIPCVELSFSNPVSNEVVSINNELAASGLTRWSTI